MITKSNLRNVLKALGFSQSDSSFTKHFEKHNCGIRVDCSGETNTPFYPTDHCCVLRLLTVQAAPIEEQRIALQKIETYEAAITTAKSVLSACADKKKMILEK
ncbi:hypothetical protein H0R92_02490 [Treponema sp. OMZ 840]|uniref:hypothetical protein n=1 Tax=Treponema sp. OMZ 840 TaxID=244313 RepID=UPI003D921671